MRDHNGQQLAYVYFEEELGRRSAAKCNLELEPSPLRRRDENAGVQTAAEHRRCVMVIGYLIAAAMLLPAGRHVPDPADDSFRLYTVDIVQNPAAQLWKVAWIHKARS